MSKCSFILHPIPGYISNMYLVEFQGNFLLLDGGCVGDSVRIESYLKRLGKDPSLIKLAFVSHMHPDHAGGAPVLRKKYGIPIASHCNIDHWYSGLFGFFQQRIDCLMSQYSAKKMNKKYEKILFNRKLSPDFLLKDGDNLPFFGDWEVVETPGHTLYDMALYNKREATLYIGDVILSSGNKFFLPFPVTFPDLMKKTLMKLSTLKVKRLLMAHGREQNVSYNSDFFASLLPVIRRSPNMFFKIFKPFTMLAPDIWKSRFCKSKKNKWRSE